MKATYTGQTKSNIKGKTEEEEPTSKLKSTLSSARTTVREAYDKVEPETDLMIVGIVLGTILVLVIASLVCASIMYNKRQARVKF